MVDDEPLVRQTLDFCLRDNYDVIAVSSGQEALEAARKEPFPVVILDLCMEGLSGIETLRRLKEIRENQNVIILTAYQTLERAVSALNLGAFQFLTKPFEQAQLREAVARGVDAFDHQMMRESEMQERLLHVRDAFFSLLCHEFNTPMNCILGFSELLASSITDPEQSDWVEEIRKSGTHLHGILMEIVDYTAASHGAISGMHSTFRPADLLAPLAARFALRKTNLVVSDGCPPSHSITGPSESVLLIARKLVSMATHNNSPDVRLGIWLDALEPTGKALLHIEVTGTGLSRTCFGPDTLSGLKEPYWFAGSNGPGPRMALGLELATGRKIAEYVGGSIDVFPTEKHEIGFLAKIPVRCSPAL